MKRFGRSEGFSRSSQEEAYDALEEGGCTTGCGSWRSLSKAMRSAACVSDDSLMERRGSSIDPAVRSEAAAEAVVEGF